ncbi:hypothetical protein RRG08_033868 [Elysia crispata]|uniref:Uncharacterized protein n=1 Tax=Elysia crispata TaxID=231223 RepID=A0AAE1B8S6_9GAST|nr:hypothetical protein RRG08_033868 [Elysia crispata]
MSFEERTENFYAVAQPAIPNQSFWTPTSRVSGEPSEAGTVLCHLAGRSISRVISMSGNNPGNLERRKDTRRLSGVTGSVVLGSAPSSYRSLVQNKVPPMFVELVGGSN